MKTSDENNARSLTQRIENFGRALTAKELAEFLSLSTLTIYRLAKAGCIPCLRIGSSLRFDPHTVAAYLRQHAIEVPCQHNNNFWIAREFETREVGEQGASKNEPSLEQIYAHFREFCANVGIENPMSARPWFETTEYLVKEPPISKPPVSTVPKYCRPRNPAKDLCRAHIKAVGPGVRQFRITSRGGFYNFKSCRACGGLLLKSRFSKQGKCLRSVCRRCDNLRRIQARQSKQATLSLQEHEVLG